MDEINHIYYELFYSLYKPKYKSMFDVSKMDYIHHMNMVSRNDNYVKIVYEQTLYEQYLYEQSLHGYYNLQSLCSGYQRPNQRPKKEYYIFINDLEYYYRNKCEDYELNNSEYYELDKHSNYCRKQYDLNIDLLKRVNRNEMHKKIVKHFSDYLKFMCENNNYNFTENTPLLLRVIYGFMVEHMKHNPLKFTSDLLKNCLKKFLQKHMQKFPNNLIIMPIRKNCRIYYMKKTKLPFE